MSAISIGVDFDAFDRAGASRRAMTSDERWSQILGLMQFAADVTAASPDAERIRAFKASQEDEWQRVQQRLFANVPRV